MYHWKKKLITVLCTLLPVLVAVGIAIFNKVNNRYTLQITLDGEQEVFMECGGHYEMTEAHAQFWGDRLEKTPVSVAVDRSGEVNEKVPGTYDITYTAEYRGVVSTLHQTVHVLDREAPTITLTEDPESYTLPGQPYEEEGYRAWDNCDGDITHLVSSTESDGKVTYTVTDSAGNKTEVVREIRYNDPIPPTLTLKGGSCVAMRAGKPFQEPGYSAQDNCEGDITQNVRVTGGVDGYQPGTYTVEYTVTDHYGNEAKASRTVIVSPHSVQEYVENPSKVIYLTFDDGPGSATPRLLDVLKKYNVKVTFFVVNTGCIGTIARSAAEGHTIAIHTATHRFHDVYASEEAYFNDLTTMQTIIRDLTGQEATILRFPGGSSNTISKFNPGIMTRLTALVKEKGFRYYDWNVDSNDAGGASTANEVFQNVVAGIGNKSVSVVLQHDIKGFSVDAVERIINWGLANGYTFLPLTMDSPTCEHGVLN